MIHIETDKAKLIAEIADKIAAYSLNIQGGETFLNANADYHRIEPRNGSSAGFTSADSIAQVLSEGFLVLTAEKKIFETNIYIDPGVFIRNRTHRQRSTVYPVQKHSHRQEHGHTRDYQHADHRDESPLIIFCFYFHN